MPNTSQSLTDLIAELLFEVIVTEVATKQINENGKDQKR